MNEDEVVDTSDPEEREGLEAEKVGYWQHVPSQVRSRSLSVTSLSSLSSSPISPVPEVPVPDPNPATRYPLRARNAQQINPYAYDKGLYMRLMQSNPDAIVRVTSPKRKTDGYGRAASEETELDNDDMEEDVFVHPRRKVYGVLRRSDDLGFLAHEDTAMDEDDQPEATRPPRRKSTSPGRWNDVIGSPSHQDMDMVDIGETYEEDGMGTPSRKSVSLRRRGETVSVDSESQEDDGTGSESHFPASPRLKDKALRDLGKLWPAVMINRYLQDQSVAPVQRKRALPRSNTSDEEEGLLQPGKTRVRIMSHSPRAIRDIKGDSESSDEPSDSSLERGYPPSSEVTSHITSPVIKRISRRKSSSVTPIYSEDESTSSDDGLDDTEITAWLGEKSVFRKANRKHSLPREDLIDWMLTRTRTVGANPRRVKRTPTKSGVKGRHRLQVVTGGAQKVLSGRQTLLTFERANHRRQSSSHHNDPRRRSSPGMLTTEDINGKDAGPGEGSSPKHKRRIRPHGPLHVFSSNGARISSGRRKNATLRVNVEDEGFRRALVPPTVRGNGDVRNHSSTPKTKWQAQGNSLFAGPLDAYVTNIIEPIQSRHSAQLCEIKPDFDIPFLTPGIAFRGDTYLGKAWLHELVTILSNESNAIAPFPYSTHGLELSASMSVPDFSTALTVICDRLLEFASSPVGNHAVDLKQWEGIMHVVCQLVSWLPTGADAEDCLLLQTVVREQVLRLINGVEERENCSEDIVFTVYWFTVELSARLEYTLPRPAELSSPGTDVLVQCIMRTMQRLLMYGLQKTMDPIQTNRDGFDTRSVPERTAELWISLFHLLDKCDICSPNLDVGPHVHPLWRVLYQILQSNGVQSGLESSETIWRMIFSLCSLSQFSVHGMTTSTCRIGAAWELVTVALNHIRLGAELAKDPLCPERSLDKRDAYIGIVVSRCFILCDRWHWDLNHASPMFHQIAEIFRTRSFANLRREASDFPAFMLENNFELLFQYKTGDTAFELFLKLIVQAAKNASNDVDRDARMGSSPMLKKILSLAIPIGSVPFTKANPPSLHELSMLYNRISAVAIAVYLDSTPSNVRFRLTHARQYADFKAADETTRMACIRGAMYFALLMQHRRIPLDDVSTWFADMTIVLVDEFKETAHVTDQTVNVTKDRLMFSVQVLLGSIRFILETLQRDPPHPKPEYPDPVLLEGPWVTSIFSNRAGLTNVVRTGIEIRRLVQSYLNARAAVIPPPQLQCSISAPCDENQESQDEYGALELDLNDPELLAALGDEPPSHEVIVMKEKDARVSRTIDAHVFPAIHRLTCRFFNGSSSKAEFSDYGRETDRWVDCWVGCANVIVQNQIRGWPRFFHLGPQCWEMVVRHSWRQRAHLRFVSVILRHDPKTYLTHQIHFLRAFFESLVTGEVTMEHEYVSLLFTVDALQHSLLRGISHLLDRANNRFEVTRSRFLDLRLEIIKVIFKNLAELLRAEAILAVQNQTNVEILINMFSTMDTVKQELAADAGASFAYLDFCKGVCIAMLQYVELSSQPQLASWVDWVQSL